MQDIDDLTNTDPLSEEEQRQLASLMAGRDYILITRGPEKDRVFCNLGFEANADKARASETLRLASDSLFRIAYGEKR